MKQKQRFKNDYKFSYLIFNKDSDNILWITESFFNKLHWENWISTCGRIKFNMYLLHCTKTNSKIKNPNIKAETLKMMCEENMGIILRDMGRKRVCE